MRRAFTRPQRAISNPHGISETLCLDRHSRPQASAPMAPAARQARRGNRRMVAPSIPPSAATGNRAIRARCAQRTAPMALTSGWLRVGNAGDRKASAAPARRARCKSAKPWAELVIGPRTGRSTLGQRPDRRWTPAPRLAARRVSPATTRTRRRARQILARSRPSAARPGSPSCRSTIPARPRGRRAAAGRGSGSRRASVNSHSGGMRERRPAATARAQATRLASMGLLTNRRP